MNTDNVALLWLLIGVSVVGCNSLALSPILSDLSLAFNQTPQQVARAAAAYGGATAFASFFLARHGENFGMRRMLRLGTFCLALGIGTCALANGWVLLTLSQAIAGMAAGVMLPAIYAMASSIAPEGKESVYVGRVITGWSLAMVFGIPFAALITDMLSWRHAYAMMSLICVVALLGFSRLPAYRRKQKSKALGTREIMAIPTVLAALSICFLFMLSFYGIYIFIGDYTRSTLAISASSAGLFVLSYGAGFAIASICDASIDNISPMRALPFVLIAITSVYASMFVFIGNYTGVLLACFAWGFANHVGLNCILVILNSADRNNRAAIMGLYSCITYLTVMLATLIFGWLYSAFSFNVLISAAMFNCLLAASLAAMWLPGKRPET